jgi:N-acetylmuramoyl-L-alanine amidase
MPANELLLRLADVYAGESIRHPQLRAVTLAQWMVESGRATSKLATEHYNFGGLKWRREMASFATRILYEAHDGKEYYCKFATI